MPFSLHTSHYSKTYTGQIFESRLPPAGQFCVFKIEHFVNIVYMYLLMKGNSGHENEYLHMLHDVEFSTDDTSICAVQQWMRDRKTRRM